MEYAPEISIFGLKMMVESGLEKIFLKFLHATFSYFIKVPKITNSVIKITIFPQEGIDFKINFSRLLLTIIFRPKIVFLVTDSILRVNPMYESVK